jgi:hypothetical protein
MFLSWCSLPAFLVFLFIQLLTAPLAALSETLQASSDCVYGSTDQQFRFLQFPCVIKYVSSVPCYVSFSNDYEQLQSSSRSCQVLWFQPISYNINVPIFTTSTHILDCTYLNDLLYCPECWCVHTKAEVELLLVPWPHTPAPVPSFHFGSICVSNQSPFLPLVQLIALFQFYMAW